VRPGLKDQATESPRNAFIQIIAMRMQDWKVLPMERRAKRLARWFEPFVKLRAPRLFNLRGDPFERADEKANSDWDWFLSHACVVYMMQAVVGSRTESFVRFPPRQKPASFDRDAVMRDLKAAGGVGNP